jgi:hypothetical protein
MLAILTKSPQEGVVSSAYLRQLAKRLLRRQRGPQAVVASLLRGLNELRVQYKHNPKTGDLKPSDVVWVNGGIEALRWAIEAKASGRIKAIFAGPNLVTMPLDENKIMLDNRINKIIFPSQWTKDFFVSFDPAFADKIDICPAGVAVPEQHDKHAEYDALIFLKNPEAEPMANKIADQLHSRGLTNKLLRYGKFGQQQYYQLLEGCRFMVYVSNSESQGIALQEAWIRNVPTLVWNRGYMEYQGQRWGDDKMSAPYLTPECGLFFGDIEEFEGKAAEFMSQLEQFTPRQYAIDTLSDRVCTQKLLNIIETNE